MMDQLGPCGATPAYVHVILGALNVVQTVMLAIVAQRAVRKNGEEKRRHDNTQP
jgi:hypothetical protein